jgi:hypothetical protein|uniref:Uncharacterized protein n=1 Tax=Zea mays TaxID=4577 RepID=A0A804LPX0_MAIZE
MELLPQPLSSSLRVPRPWLGPSSVPSQLLASLLCSPRCLLLSSGLSSALSPGCCIPLRWWPPLSWSTASSTHCRALCSPSESRPGCTEPFPWSLLPYCRVPGSALLAARHARSACLAAARLCSPWLPRAARAAPRARPALGFFSLDSPAAPLFPCAHRVLLVHGVISLAAISLLGSFLHCSLQWRALLLSSPVPSAAPTPSARRASSSRVPSPQLLPCGALLLCLSPWLRRRP